MNTRKENSENVEENKVKSVIKKIKKSEYLKGLMKLKNQEYILERGLVNLIDNMKLDADVIKSLSREEKELSAKRQNIVSTLRKTISDISNDVKTVKLIISDPEQIQQLDVNKLKSKLIGISKKLDDFKNTCPLQTLSEKGNELDSDLKEFSSRLHKYNSVNLAIKSSTIDLSSLNKDKKKNHEDYDDYEEIEDFHTLIAKTGYTQHWSNEDHSLFLKIRKQCKNVPTLVNAIRRKCPDLTIETIINHETWYKLYLDLREKQRSKIKEWRKRKELNKVTKLQNEGIIDQNNLPIEKIPSNVVNKDILNDKENRSDLVADKNLNKKELIKKWKLEKEQKRLMDEEQSKLRLESKRALDEKRTRIRIENIRESLRDYRNKKSMDKLLENSKKELQNIQEYDPILIKEFRKQDEEYVRKRRMQLSRTNKTRLNKSRTLRKYQLNNTNTSTLCKPTKAWQEKCKIEDYKIDDNQKVRYIKDLPKLHTRWRNEESIDLQNYFAL
ncbi:coiled-coil domain-containing protein 112-like [Polistes fuscatus]|uniref:coiled-coil domain-containing protein 112-like n=1 Tax=Polistes fuscatus TaxID=30207 RepID=UPI001CAA005E|nr:coiled-coil domain-containing protein 112-like [Polistes fuscatus]